MDAGRAETEVVLTKQGSMEGEASGGGLGEGDSVLPAGARKRSLSRCIALWAGDEFGRLLERLAIGSNDIRANFCFPALTKR